MIWIPGRIIYCGCDGIKPYLQPEGANRSYPEADCPDPWRRRNMRDHIAPCFDNLALQIN